MLTILDLKDCERDIHLNGSVQGILFASYFSFFVFFDISGFRWPYLFMEYMYHFPV